MGVDYYLLFSISQLPSLKEGLTYQHILFVTNKGFFLFNPAKTNDKSVFELELERLFITSTKIHVKCDIDLNHNWQSATKYHLMYNYKTQRGFECLAANRHQRNHWVPGV